MREIKFRGKRTDNGEWIEGFLFQIWDKSYTLLGTVNGVPDMIEVIPNSVGQSIDMKDKNGKEIFEGDIVTTGRLQYFIKYEDGAFYAYHCKIKDVYLTPYRWGRLARFEELNREIEVMDNIHDNPELLK